MSIIRSPRPEANYTVIENSLINNFSLDWRELGVLIYLLSKPDNWSVSITHLSQQKNTGISGVKAAIKALKLAGYITTKRKSSGQVDWFVFDTPQVDIQPKEKPQVEKPHVEKPHVEIQPLIKTDIKTTPETSNKQSAKRFIPPTIEEADEYIAEKGYSFTGEDFVLGNNAKGWVIGKANTQMKCWKSAMHTWQKFRSNTDGASRIKAVSGRANSKAANIHDRSKERYQAAIEREQGDRANNEVLSEVRPQVQLTH